MVAQSILQARHETTLMHMHGRMYQVLLTRDVGEASTTLLHAAARAGDSSTIQFLLDAGASPSARDALRDTPLDVARQTKQASG